MSTEPADTFLNRVESVESRFNSLQDDIALRWVNDDIGTMDSQLRDLPSSIQQVRSRGYVFKSYLEKKTVALASQWDELRPRVVSTVDEQSRNLRYQADLFRQRLPFLRPNRSEIELSTAESTLRDLESRVSAAKGTLQGMYETLKGNVQQTVDQVKEVVWVLDEVDGATFKLYPGECVVSAVKAQWMTSEKEGQKGIFYLTDERVLFEQEEEVATKKVLFIATEKKKVQELEWEAPLSQIESVQASEKGGAILGIGKKEILEFRFGSSVRVRSPLLRLEADSDAWQALIGRGKSGDIAGERTSPKDKTVVEAARAAPTKCTTCGATITQAVVKGMTEIKCEYCGAIVRL
jgi:predicted  nucleic acid-binding Zn-ribbon protein